MKNRFSIAVKLLRRNIKTIVMFEAIYKLFTTAVFTPLIVELVKLSLKLAGINYLTNARFEDFITKPTTIAILFLALLLFSIFCLVEMSAMSYCFQMSYHGYSVNVTDMLKEGGKAAFRLISKNNFMMIILILILMPITHLIALSGYVSMMQVPVFIIELIKTKKTAVTIILCVYTFLAVFAVRWINSINYYTIEKMNFKNAKKASINLNKKHYFGLVLSFVLWQAVVFIFLIVMYVFVTFIIGRVLLLFIKYKSAYNITLLCAKELYDIWITLYSCIIVPISFAILTGYFYARKEKINEETVVPAKPEARNSTKSKFKRVLSLVVFISAGLNIIYISSDFGVSRGFANVQLLSKSMIAAHRGYSAEAPENTIPAFEAAVDNFADYVELDVQETKDGEVIVMHDSNFKRVGGLNKKVWNVNYAEIEYLDVGSWFSKEYEGERIPTLEETLIMAKGRLKLNIEIKLTGHEKNLERSVVELIEKYGMEKECVITSFQAKALKKVKEYNKNIKTGYVLHVAYGDFSDVDFADALSINYSFATPSLINDAHSSGMEVYVWTVNSAEAIHDMVENGADMIITDDPVLARETITSYEATPYIVSLVKYVMKK